MFFYLEKFDYLYINKFLELGKFNLHLEYNYSSDKTILKPVFKVNKNIDTTLIPGYVDNSGVFFEIPIVIHYVKIIEINITPIKTDENDFTKFNTKLITFDIEIFDYTFDKSKRLSLVIENNHRFTFERINSITNLLNLYLSNSNDIDKLDITNLIDFVAYYRFNEDAIIEFIIKEINNLEFKVYSDSRNIPGKDNRFWTEMEVRNISENIYFRELLLKIFRKKYSANTSDFGFIVELDSYYAWSPSYKRDFIEDYDFNFIKDYLKINLVKEFDSMKFTFSNLSLDS